MVRSLVQCSLRQMLENGFFHADPHGGNLLATKDASLCYLDFGMTSTLTQEQSYGIILAIVDLVNRDWENLVALYKRLGILDKDADEEPIVKVSILLILDLDCCGLGKRSRDRPSSWEQGAASGVT
mmetsp:Transcript_32059/g.124884  ORF Transcript_32059/g.124884 Transcript_32059/m.124884 type:complete len:126 (-) Transcript_32059:1322-1699(-)